MWLHWKLAWVLILVEMALNFRCAIKVSKCYEFGSKREIVVELFSNETTWYPGRIIYGCVNLVSKWNSIHIKLGRYFRWFISLLLVRHWMYFPWQINDPRIKSITQFYSVTRLAIKLSFGLRPIISNLLMICTKFVRDISRSRFGSRSRHRSCFRSEFQIRYAWTKFCSRFTIRTNSHRWLRRQKNIHTKNYTLRQINWSIKVQGTYNACKSAINKIQTFLPHGYRNRSVILTHF